MMLQEKGRSMKSGKPNKQSESGPDFDISRKFDTGNQLPPLSTRNHQKTWPSRRVMGSEDIVKNMSSVPFYLQRLEKGGDNVQEKALNFGVLDWGSLEKWAHLQKKGANRRDANYLSSNNASSSPFLTVGSSSRSTRSSNSPLAQSKRSPILDARNYSAETIRTKLRKEQKCGQMLWSPDSGAANTIMSTSHSHENEKCKGSDKKGIYQGMFDPNSDARCSSSTPKGGYNTPVSAYDMGRPQIGDSREAGTLRSGEQQRFSGNLRFPEFYLQEQCSVIEGVWDHLHLQEAVHKGRISCDSAVLSKGRPAEVNRNSFSGSFPTDEIPFTNPPPRVPHSCPLPPTSKGKHDITTTDSFSGHSAVNMADRSGQSKSPTLFRRELSPHRLLRAGISRIRSSSFREGSSGRQLKQTSCSRGRRSLLRRMLDPLSKPNNHSHFSEPIASSLSHLQAQDMDNSNKLPMQDELELTKGQCKSSSIKPSVGQCTKSGSPVQDEKHATSTRQALLKLAWSNGFPVFIFLSNDNDILAATMRRRNIAEKNVSGSIYTLFNAREIKKKGGIWMGQGNKKIKRQGLVYNVVGQVKVSSSYCEFSTEDSRSCSVVREFVLFGSQLVPNGHEQVGPLLNSELAAVVVKVPGISPESFKLYGLKSSNFWNSSRTNLPEDRSRFQVECAPKNLSSIVAILPSAVHGLSAVGEPPPLIKRWKLGGGCDCGGWDEGCMLTVLTDKGKEMDNSGSARSCTKDGTRRIQLYNQGEARAKEGYALTMVALKEGVYNVEFGSSIALLQAFAICIATLHSWTPTSLASPTALL